MTSNPSEGVAEQNLKREQADLLAQAVARRINDPENGMTRQVKKQIIDLTSMSPQQIDAINETNTSNELTATARDVRDRVADGLQTVNAGIHMLIPDIDRDERKKMKYPNRLGGTSNEIDFDLLVRDQGTREASELHSLYSILDNDDLASVFHKFENDNQKLAADRIAAIRQTYTELEADETMHNIGVESVTLPLGRSPRNQIETLHVEQDVLEKKYARLAPGGNIPKGMERAVEKAVEALDEKGREIRSANQRRTQLQTRLGQLHTSIQELYSGMGTPPTIVAFDAATFEPRNVTDRMTTPMMIGSESAPASTWMTDPEHVRRLARMNRYNNRYGIGGRPESSMVLDELLTEHIHDRVAEEHRATVVAGLRDTARREIPTPPAARSIFAGFFRGGSSGPRQESAALGAMSSVLTSPFRLASWSMGRMGFYIKEFFK